MEIWIDSIYEVLCVFMPCVIYQRMAIKREQKGSRKHVAGVLVFVFYLYLCLNVAGVGSIWGIGRYKTLIRMEEINFIPFSSDGMMTYVLNVIMFMPLGFLLPLLWKNMRKGSRVFWTSFGFSLSIEICQLFNLRATDIDDLMMNTLGGMVGFLIWKIFKTFFYTNVEKEETIEAKEAVFYLILAILGRFLLYHPTVILSFFEKMGWY